LSLRIAVIVPLFLLAASPALADRRATRSESRAMWRVVDPDGMCVHHRGHISKSHARSSKWGTVVVADNHCGNGQYVLRRRNSARRWKVAGAGSDWGNPNRCADDLHKIPRAVLEDFFGRPYCRG
jgi:hypothetical protein